MVGEGLCPEVTDEGPRPEEDNELVRSMLVGEGASAISTGKRGATSIPAPEGSPARKRPAPSTQYEQIVHPRTEGDRLNTQHIRTKGRPSWLEPGFVQPTTLEEAVALARGLVNVPAVDGIDLARRNHAAKDGVAMLERISHKGCQREMASATVSELLAHCGQNMSEVCGTMDLVVRVVSSVDKKLEVNKAFCEIFQEKKFPRELCYNSKAILLFQNIEGADVSLFGMYVQEYGSECAVPNQRTVCISYLDSVKYFMPEVQAKNGEALRTFVYHEILIGYLDYCKKRGFTSCYMWSCPPRKQDDYIFYRRPKTQKIPMDPSLLGWYKRALQKAAKENIIVEHTNIYDHYFEPPSDCKTEITASRVPYFDGDYWPEEAQTFLEKHRNLKNSKEKKFPNDAKHEFSSRSPEDILLMQEFGKKIKGKKERFILVHLQHICKCCYKHIISGRRWVCNARKNFHLCDKCHSMEENDISTSVKYSYAEVEVQGVPTDTSDGDGILQSEHLDDRLVFLKLCKENNYQFNTLHHAKHSTQMILNHLRVLQKGRSPA